MKKITKNVLKSITWLLITFILFGLLLPFLISAKNTLLVLLGIFIFIIWTILFSRWIIVDIFPQIKNYYKEN